MNTYRRSSMAGGQRPPLRKTSKKTKLRRSPSPYRLLPMLILGLIVFLAAIFLIILLWSLITFIAKNPVPETQFLPAVFYFIATFISSFAIAYVTKGRYALPLVLNALIVSVVSLLFAGIKEFSLFGFIGRTVLVLVVAFLAKFIFQRPHFPKPKKRPPPRVPRYQRIETKTDK